MPYDRIDQLPASAPSARNNLPKHAQEIYKEAYNIETRIKEPAALRGFDWNGYRFPAGHRVLLDLCGTNHDARLWEAPEAFRPERFRQWDEGAFDFTARAGAITSPATAARASGSPSGL